MINKATVFISTAALMAGTACGVWAETNDTVSASFDRSERSVYDSNVNHNPDMVAEVGSHYMEANNGYANPSDAYASPNDAYGSTNSDASVEIETGVAGATGGMRNEAVPGTGATAGENSSLKGDGTVSTEGGADSGASAGADAGVSLKGSTSAGGSM